MSRDGIIAHNIVDLSRCIIKRRYREVLLMGANIVEIEITNMQYTTDLKPHIPTNICYPKQSIPPPKKKPQKTPNFLFCDVNRKY